VEIQDSRGIQIKDAYLRLKNLFRQQTDRGHGPFQLFEDYRENK